MKQITCILFFRSVRCTRGSLVIAVAVYYDFNVSYHPILMVVVQQTTVQRITRKSVRQPPMNIKSSNDSSVILAGVASLPPSQYATGKDSLEPSVYHGDYLFARKQTVLLFSTYHHYRLSTIRTNTMLSLHLTALTLAFLTASISALPACGPSSLSPRAATEQWSIPIMELHR